MRAFYRRWLSPEGYLGLHLVIGFLLATLCGYLFTQIADHVFGTAQTLRTDAQAQAFVRSINTPGLTSVMRVITHFGDELTLVVLSVAIGLILLFKRSHRRLVCFAAIMMGGAKLNYVLKDLYHRNRPDEAASLTFASGFSFPSGHSMGSMLFFGGLAYVLYFTVPKHWAKRAASILFCVIAVSLIGGSRIYLGVHYLSDVIAGFVAGLCWIGICITGTEGWIRLRDRKKSGAKETAS